MKFTAVLSTFFAALAVANPRPGNSDYPSLSARAPDKVEETDEWKRAFAAAKKANVNIVANNFYYFTVVTPKGKGKGDPTHLNAEELKRLQEKLGFDHIAVVVGKMEETRTKEKKTKNNKDPATVIKRDFKARKWDLAKMEKTDETSIRSRNWLANKDVELDMNFGGGTTAAKEGKIKKMADDWKKANPLYKVETNNCAIFKDKVIDVLK